jgi:hypothetical protein
MLDIGFHLNYLFVLTSVWFHAICLHVILVDGDVHCTGRHVESCSHAYYFVD